MEYNNIIPTKLDEYIKTPLIEDLKKIDEIQNMILYSKKGYGKSHLKNILIEKYKKKYKNINIVYLDLEEDLKKNIETKEYIFNILKLTKKKLFIIDVNVISNETQLYLKSLLKNYKNINFIICLNNITNLIENFSSFFLIFKLNDNFFNIHKNYILDIMKKNTKITNGKLKLISKKSKNFYILKKYYNYIYLFKEEYLKNFSNFESITMNDNKEIVKTIINNKLDENIKYVDKLLNIGYSETDIINFIINFIKTDSIQVENKNIFNLILNNNHKYTYIDLIYYIDLLSIT